VTFAAAIVSSGEPDELRSASALEVLRAFLRLGTTSFGGPIAHLGYFREEFVVRRGWLCDRAFAELVALCQFLPGPASSQVGFSIGLMRAGYGGALAAWIGFTLPSALLMTGFAYLAGSLGGSFGNGLLHGLGLVAVAVVAHAVLGMARRLCPDRARAFIGILALVFTLLMSAAVAQVAVIGAGALLGYALCRNVVVATEAVPERMRISRRAGSLALALFLLGLAVFPILQRLLPSPALALFAAFYRSGALVFGGGHVVLPLLRAAVVSPGWVSDGEFIAGYGAAQAMPGPLFTFAAYLGAAARTPAHGIAGAALGLIGIFLPGILILLAALPFWETLRRHAAARAALLGVNAAVVGLLAAALYSPLWISTVRSPADLLLALAGLGLLVVARVPPWAVVILTALASVAFAR
jgi:chromate transporter